MNSIKATHYNRLVLRFGRLLLATMAIAMVSFNSSGQITGPLDRQTPLALAPGAPAGSRIEDLASVNLFNGNLNFALPLATAGGRGGIEVPLALTIERHWQVQTRCFVTITGQTSCQKFVSSMWWGNQQVGYGPGIVQGRGADTYTTQSNGGSPICQPNGGVVFTFTDPSGTEHELRDLLTNGQPHIGGACGFLRGTNFASVDGTSITFVSDSVINDDCANGPDPARPTGYLLFADGTRYRVENGLVMWIRDRNGNKVSYVYEVYNGNVSRVKIITDTLGRTITVNYDVNDPTYGLCDQIVVPGFGMTSRIVSITKASLSAALRYDQPQPQTYGQLFPEGGAINGGTQFNPSIVSAVYLPNGQSYKFYYNTYGELARIQVPAGGAVDYDYQGGLTNEPNSGAIIDSRYVYRRVVAKRVFTSASDLGSNTKVTTYSRPESWSSGTGNVNSVGFVSIENRAVDNSFLSYEKHYFHGAAAHSFITVNPYPAWNDGQEYQAEIFDADETTVLRRSTKNWQQRAHVSWWSNYAASMHLNPNDEPANDPRVVETTQVIEPSGANLVSKVSAINPQTLVVGFDQHNNQTDSWQYDYGVGAPSNYPKTHVHTDYLAVNPANNISYADPVNGSSYAANDVHLRDVPRARQIYSINPTNGTETLVAQSETRYDEPALSLLTYGAVISWDDPGSARGNATTIRNWVDTSGSWLETHAQYDQCGSVRNIWDAKGNQSQVEYSSAYAYAYPTLTRTPVPDPSGQNGSTNAFVATNVFDFNTGLVTSSTDANNVVTTLEYNDALSRPTRTVRAYGTSLQSQTVIVYDDVNRIVTTTSDQSSYNDNVLKGETIYDGLGRPTEARQYESGTNYTAVQTQYDTMGRAYKNSNPFRPWNSETAVWTTTVFDPLGRIISVTTPDGAVVNTYYNGNQIMGRDQTGKERISQTNALGRLSDVWEVTSADDSTEGITFPNRSEVTAGYRTKYAYDTLGNLTTSVQQKGTGGTTQTRSFVYNSLSRLVAATNPESGTTNYTYDDNGNLTQKTDPRLLSDNQTHVMVTYDYDALNRPKTRSYNDGTSPNYFDRTPAVTYTYDSSSITNGKGRLASVVSCVSTYSYGGYDALGHVLGGTQTTDGVGYAIGYSYNLGGEMTSQTYPSGRVVTNSFDNAGRLNGLTGQKSGEANKTYADSFGYWSSGAIKDLRLGNNLWEHTNLNARLQTSEIGLGTTQGGVDRLRLNYDYGAMTNNGNLQSQTITVSTIGGATGFTATQTYSYDSLNRLSSVQENNGSSWTQNLTYDRYGNRNFASGTTLPASLGTVNNPDINAGNNRLDSNVSGQTNVTYDPAGNLTHDVNGHAYAYDGENKQTTYDDGPSANGGATYYYDGDGRRVKKVVGGSPMASTVFVYNIGGQLVAEYSDAQQSSNGGTSYLTEDNLGTPRVTTDAGGNVKSRHDYQPFGEELFAGTGGRTPQQGYSASDGVRQHFTQKERDNETGLDFFGARYYSSTQGRFTSPDDFLNDTHVIDPASWNQYAYVRNNPLALVDPGGEEVYSTNLTDEQKKQIIDDWKKKTGYKSISFDKNNQLVIDTAAGYKKGSATARTELLAAATSTSKIFNLVAVDNTPLSQTVAFTENIGTMNSVNNTTGARTDTYDVRIDFGDFKQLKGEKKPFSIGINLIHEFEHGMHEGQPTGSDSPNGPTDPGPLERTYINPIRQELGLSQRSTYSGVLQSTGKYQGYVELPFRNNKGKEKILRWQNSVVGGRRTP